MACHELAALRLGLMEVLGIDDQAEKQHELKELGDVLTQAGPLKSLSEGGNLERLIRFYSHSLVSLQEKVSQMPPDDKNLPYYNTLLVVTKKVEQDLQSQLESMNRFWRDLDEIHHYLHELYPTD